MIRFALFGAGFIERVHAGNVANRPRATLTAVYDVNTQAEGEPTGRLGARVASSPEDIWAADNVDAVTPSPPPRTRTPSCWARRSGPGNPPPARNPSISTG